MSFLSLSEAIGTSSVFFIFAGMSSLGMLHTYFLVPETKGKSLEEIQVSTYRFMALYVGTHYSI
jgi:hypothetical protein